MRSGTADPFAVGLRDGERMPIRIANPARSGPPRGRRTQISIIRASRVTQGLRVTAWHAAHPLVQFLDGPSGRRASLIGRGLDVWEVIDTVRDNAGSVPDAADYLQVPVGLVEAAVSYYGEYLDEIDAEVGRNEAEYGVGREAAARGESALRA